MRKIVAFLLASALLAAAAAQAAPIVVGASNTGPIPDGDPAGRTLSFAVSGVSSPLRSVSVSLNLTHSFAGDLTATLIAPGGAARLVLFGRPGTGRSSSFGDSTNFGGVYTFTDTGFPDFVPLLQALTDTEVLPPGSFRTVSRGAPLRSNAGGCPTSLRGVFGGLTPQQANGIWTLVLTDSTSPDAGTVSAATLTLDTVLLFANGFEGTGLGAPGPHEDMRGAEAPAHCINKVIGDFTGDGVTDYALVRANGSARDWVIRENTGNGSASAAEIRFSHGVDGDLFDSFDLDGDRIADPAAWRPGPAGTARFLVRLSSRDGAVREVIFGQTGDTPNQSGDYDGDGIDDPAVFRLPPFGGSAGPIQLIYLSSQNETPRSVGTGSGTQGDQFSISGFDYGGDGRADVVTQSPDSGAPSTGRFRVYDSLTGGLQNTFTHGNASDFLIPGNYVGTPRADYTVSRTVGGNREWISRDAQTGAVAPTVVFSVTGDQRIGGDYDGDGIADHAFFRATASPGPIGFQVRPSTNTATVWTLDFGLAQDFAIAGSRVQ